MKKIVSILLVICFLMTLTSVVLANEKSTTNSVKLSYPSIIDGIEYEFVEIEVPQEVNNLPKYAIESLLESKGLSNNQWNEIPKGIKLNSLTIEDDKAVIDFDKAFLNNITNNHSIYMIINSIKNTIFQFENINSFVITVDGEKIDCINDYILNEEFKRNMIELNEITLSTPIVNGPIVPDPVVYLDAGHGGADPGAVGADGTEEADINLIIALKVRDYLETQGATVIMSRTSDITKDMNTRINEANSSNPDFIVTIHCNSSTSSSPRGFRTYYTATHDVAFSQDLAESIDARLIYTSIPRFNTPITHTGIGLLNYTNDPAVLVECGFMSNSQDLQLLKQPSEQTDIAYNIFVGIRKWWWGN